MKKTQRIFSKEMLLNYIVIFYVISIVLDLHIFYNSISTLIRIIIISMFFLIIFIKYATRKEKKILIIYFILLFLYIMIHIFNTLNFNTFLDLKYNTFSEILYFVKMLMNVFIIFIVYKLDVSKEKFYKLITISSFLISCLIVIPNLLKIGYTSYDFNIINVNFIEWFKNNDINFLTSSGKGFFHLTNQISAILVLYLPLLLINLKEKINIFKILTILLTITSLYILGTRVSSYSPFLILGITIIVYLIMCIAKINIKFEKKYFTLLIFFMFFSYLFYSVCPLLNRNEYYNHLFNNSFTENSENTTESISLNEMSNDELKKYLENFNISPLFFNEYYPLEYDREFYEYYISLETNKINDTRFLEKSIISRIKELNNNSVDNYFGIGYNRVMNVFNIESDYVMQYYSLGIIGCILILGVNIILILYMYFKTLFNLKRYFTFENIMIMFTATYFLVTAYFTGNILNAISCIIPISFVIGYNLSYFNKKNKFLENEYYLGFKTTTKSEEEILNNIFKDKNQAIIYNINPIILNNFINNEDVKKEFNKSNYNIPDGNGIVLVSKLTSNNIRKSVPGIELMESICEKSVKKKYSIYLYGAVEDSVSKTKKKLEKKYKGINIVGYKNGYCDEKKVLKDIIKNKPDILFVALGSPKQEEFIISNKEKLKNIKIIMPVGGSFDVISGNISRAPFIIRKLKLEWLYRMIKEPKRFKQLFVLIKFVFLVLFVNFWYNEKDMR